MIFQNRKNSCYQTFKEEMIPVLYIVFQNRIEAEGKVSNSLSESTIHLKLKPAKEITK